MVEIYQGKKELRIESFWRDFYIIEDHSSGEIFWSIDFQESRPGIIKSWIQRGDTNPQIRGVLPDWSLCIDGITMERKFYVDVLNLKGKKVELQNQGNRFIFRFDKTT